MVGRDLFDDGAAWSRSFYERNDARKFSQRRIFMFLAIQTYAIFGVLDGPMGGAAAPLLINIRIITVILLSLCWGVFATSADYRIREFSIMMFAMVSTTSLLTMIVCAQGPAADYYPFALGAIQVFGGALVVPQFRTMAVSALAMYVGFWGTVHMGQTSLTSIYVNMFLLTVSTISIIVGSYTRETLERDQLRKEHQLAEARDKALVSSRDAIQANQAKSHMMANVSHELRTPMNAIIGFSEMMKEEIFGSINPPKYREYVDDIHKSGRILLSNINDLLDMARIETGKIGWEERLFPVSEVMEIAVKSSRAALPDDSIHILSYDMSDGAYVHADFDRLCQALTNLMNNAGKFSPPDSIIEITFGATATGWAFRVKDEGCGIAGEDLQRIREPFAQVGPSSYSAAKGGLGLGLAITSEIAQRLDGTLDITSTVGVGTTVSILLPNERIELHSERLSA